MLIDLNIGQGYCKLQTRSITLKVAGNRRADYRLN